MLRKKLPNTTWTESIDPRLQSPRVNIADMIIGFFDGSMLSKDELRQVIDDALEYAGSDDDDSPTPTSVPLVVKVEGLSLKARYRRAIFMLVSPKRLSKSLVMWSLHGVCIS